MHRMPVVAAALAVAVAGTVLLGLAAAAATSGDVPGNRGWVTAANRGWDGGQPTPVVAAER